MHSFYYITIVLYNARNARWYPRWYPWWYVSVPRCFPQLLITCKWNKTSFSESTINLIVSSIFSPFFYLHYPNSCWFDPSRSSVRSPGSVSAHTSVITISNRTHVNTGIPSFFSAAISPHGIIMRIPRSFLYFFEAGRQLFRCHFIFFINRTSGLPKKPSLLSQP